LQPGRVDDFAGALAPEQLSFQEIRLTAASSGDGFRRATGCALMRQQAFEDPDRGVERRANRTVLHLAVPSAVRKLLTDQPGDDTVHILVEVGTQGDDQAVDTGFDLAAEERLPGVLPTAVVSHQLHRSQHPVATWVDAEVPQQHEAVCRGSPGLALAPGGRVPPRGEERASLPLAVLALQIQQPGAPPLGGHPRSLLRDDLSRRIGKIAQRLPPDRGVRIEHPVQDGHGARV